MKELFIELVNSKFFAQYEFIFIVSMISMVINAIYALSNSDLCETVYCFFVPNTMFTIMCLFKFFTPVHYPVLFYLSGNCFIFFITISIYILYLIALVAILSFQDYITSIL